MKQSVYDATPISAIPKETTQLHFVRPVKSSKVEKIISVLPMLSKISMSKSCLERLAPKTKKIIKSSGIPINVSSERGRAIEIPFNKLLHVIEMSKDERPLREIEETTGVPKSTVHYLVKYASRTKIKNGKKTVYLDG